MHYSWDVLVAGAGPSGIAAACAAARNGARVLLIEKDARLGGLATGGLIGRFSGSASSVYFEQMQEICVRAWGRLLYDPEQAETLFMRMAAEQQVTVVTHALVIGTSVDGDGAIASVDIWTPERVRAETATVYVDATGDGALAALAGATTGGGSDVHAMLAVLLGGIDTRADRCFDAETFDALVPAIRDAGQAGEIPAAIGSVWVDPAPRGGSGILKFTVQASCVPEAEWLCRTAAAPLISLLQRGAPGYADCYPVRTAARVAAWPVRCVQGRQVLTIADVEQGRTFSDWVVSRAVPDAPLGGADPVLPFSVPYGCLLPTHAHNLLLAGRCVSADREARARCLTIPFALASGQAAGTAAALAVHIGGNTRDLDIETLQDRLLEQGVACPRPQFLMDGFRPDEPPGPPAGYDDAVPVIPEDAGILLRPDNREIAIDAGPGETQAHEEPWQEEARRSAPPDAELSADDARPVSIDSGFEIEEWSAPETDAGIHQTLRFLPEEEPAVPAYTADPPQPEAATPGEEAPIPGRWDGRIRTQQDRIGELTPGRMFSSSRAIPDPQPSHGRSAPDNKVRDLL
jgi:hypothetical protein